MIFNAAFYMAAVTLGSAAVYIWVDPAAARWLVRILTARAAAVEASRKAYKAAYQAALQEFPQQQQQAEYSGSGGTL